MTKRTGGHPSLVATTYDTLLANEITVGVAAQPLVSGTLACYEVLIQADPSNTADVLIGNAHNHTIVLTAGTPISIPINDASKVWLRAVSGNQRVGWVAVA